MRLATIIFSLLIFLSSTAFAEDHPLYCADAYGARYLWDSPQCAQARAQWAKEHSPTTANSQGIVRAPKGTVIVPGGTAIAFQVTDEVSSGTANVGDTFGLKVAKDVVIDGWVVVAKGAGGLGEVLKVDRAGAHGHAGSLGIQLDWVYGADGNKIKLSAEQKAREGENKAGVSSTMTIVSWAFLGLPGLFTHNFVKGHEVDITPQNTVEHPLAAFVDASVYVRPQVKANDAGFAPAVPATSPVPTP